MSNIPTSQDAEFFALCVKKWQSILHLGDWRIEKGLKPAKQAMASVEFNEGARLATYRLGDFGAEINDEILDAQLYMRCFMYSCMTLWRQRKTQNHQKKK